ncbi:MAG: DUF3618 domain-containing protein [Actinomycetota bacterium]
MADPDGAVVARGAAAARSVVDSSNPDALVAEIERTRENLAQTIDTLAERVSPANNVRRLRERVEEQAARPEVRKVGAAVGLVVVSLIIYRIVRRK